MAMDFFNIFNYDEHEVMNLKKKWPLLASVVASAASASIAALGYTISNRVMYMKQKDEQFIWNREVQSNRLDEDWFTHVAKESFIVQSPNGYPITCHKIQSTTSLNTIIILHEVTETHINSLKYAQVFARLGYNIIVYDQRRHGKTDGKTTSYGFYEKYDLQAVVEAVRSQMTHDALLGIQGESMGAATTLQYGGLDDTLFDFIIADCAFSTFEKQLHHVLMRDTPIKTAYAVKLADFFIQKRDGYTLREVAPIEAVQKISKPILYIHSLEDTYIPHTMSEALHAAKPENTRLVLFEKGEHAQSFNEQPFDYEKEIIKFLVDFHISYLPQDYQFPQKKRRTRIIQPA